MNELIEELAKRTGLPLDQAGKAFEAVIGILKEKLPPGVGDQLQGLIDGEGLTEAAGDATKAVEGAAEEGGNPLSAITEGIGKLFGKKD